MTRESRFRSYSKEKGMLYNISCPAEEMELDKFLDTIDNLMERAGVDDKFENSLYESDIVKHFEKNSDDGVLKIIEKYKGSLIARPFDKEASSEMGLINYRTHDTMELIGNIFEHDEFLFLSD